MALFATPVTNEALMGFPKVSVMLVSIDQ
jgi:hypothetical protein